MVRVIKEDRDDEVIRRVRQAFVSRGFDPEFAKPTFCRTFSACCIQNVDVAAEVLVASEAAGVPDAAAPPGQLQRRLRPPRATKQISPPIARQDGPCM